MTRIVSQFLLNVEPQTDSTLCIAPVMAGHKGR
jgi:hypothetical protein